MVSYKRKEINNINQHHEKDYDHDNEEQQPQQQQQQKQQQQQPQQQQQQPQQQQQQQQQQQPVEFIFGKYSSTSISPIQLSSTIQFDENIDKWIQRMIKNVNYTALNQYIKFFKIHSEVI
ncbi:hypothetical protein ACTFIY_007211 [Dictyostelium cf. discoideum]